MKITFGEQVYEFRPWKPAMGQVFERSFAFDCETTLIDKDHPWLTPAYVIGSAFDGRRGFFVRRDDVAAFFETHPDTRIIMHNAAFDLSVIHTLAPQLDIYRNVDEDLVWDTQLLHRLYTLGSEGHTAGGKDESTLEMCTELYTGVSLPKDVKDAAGKIVRLSYGQWLTQPPSKIKAVYLEYLALDTIATRLVYKELRRRLKKLLAASSKVWGFVSEEWLAEQVHKWGPQTHHIQLQAAIVLKAITANGIHLVMARRNELAKGLETKLAQQRKRLAKDGYLPEGKGSNKSLQAILRRLERQHPDVHFPLTPTDKYATSAEALQDLAEVVPFIRLYLEFQTTRKLLTSFVGKMARPVIHPSFGVLARSGRTSSFGELNAQNLPKDDRVRSCFVPSPGHVYIDADYSTIELATLAQACIAQFGLASKMAEAINAKKDLHLMVAARVTNKAEDKVTKEERQKAKPVNFGKPGGMGDTTLRQYAKLSYGVVFSEAEAKNISDAWLDSFPEMRAFLKDNHDTPLELAKLLRLSAKSHYEHTDDPRFIRRPENFGKEDHPSQMLACMLLKSIKVESPETRDGRPYPEGDVDYFWSRLEAALPLLAPKFQQAVLHRQPSPSLQRAIMSLVGRAGVFTLTGRLRANAGYSTRHNTIFQGLAADGCKLALWLLWRAGYRIVNFIHDEVLIEIPADSNLRSHAKTIRRLMIAGMKAVLPDLRVDVKYAATDRWCKDAKAVFGKKTKKLLLWCPTQEKENSHASATR